MYQWDEMNDMYGNTYLAMTEPEPDEETLLQALKQGQDFDEDYVCKFCNDRYMDCDCYSSTWTHSMILL